MPTLSEFEILNDLIIQNCLVAKLLYLITIFWEIIILIGRSWVMNLLRTWN